MSSIRANITNVYQSGERITHQLGLQAEPGDENANQVGGLDLRKEMSDSSSAIRHKRNPSTRESNKPDTQLELPADPNGLAQKIVYSDKSQAKPNKDSFEATHRPRTDGAKQEPKAAYQEAQDANLDTRKVHREGTLMQVDAANDRATANAVQDRESPTQPMSLSVLEQFMQKLREQAKSRSLESDDELLNGGYQQKQSDPDVRFQSESIDNAVAGNAANQNSNEASNEDQDMYTIRRRIHDDFYNSLQFQAAGSTKPPGSISSEIEVKPAESMLPAQQAPIAQRPVYEAIEQPYPIDLEDYVKKLTLALIPEMPPEIGEDPSTAGTKMLEHLQREGVFGLSPQGRYQTVNDFIRTKEFEFEMEQRSFTEDEFLLQTENAIYEVLRRGNSSSVAKSLIQAAEAVNSFRNHMIHSSGDDFSAAPADYSSVQASTSKQSVSAYNSQK